MNPIDCPVKKRHKISSRYAETSERERGNERAEEETRARETIFRIRELKLWIIDIESRNFQCNSAAKWSVCIIDVLIGEKCCRCFFTLYSLWWNILSFFSQRKIVKIANDWWFALRGSSFLRRFSISQLLFQYFLLIRNNIFRYISLYIIYLY